MCGIEEIYRFCRLRIIQSIRGLACTFSLTLKRVQSALVQKALYVAFLDNSQAVDTVNCLMLEIGIVTLGFGVCHFAGNRSWTDGRAGEDVTEDLKGSLILAIAAIDVVSRKRRRGI